MRKKRSKKKISRLLIFFFEINNKKNFPNNVGLRLHIERCFESKEEDLKTKIAFLSIRYKKNCISHHLARIKQTLNNCTCRRKNLKMTNTASGIMTT